MVHAGDARVDERLTRNEEQVGSTPTIGSKRGVAGPGQVGWGKARRVRVWLVPTRLGKALPG